jgi:hypothetical protein
VYCIAAGSVLVACGFPALSAIAGRDAAVGMSTDAAVCYGPTGWQICMDAKVTGQVQLQGTLDTEHSTQCLPQVPPSWTATQPDACIVVGDTVTVMSTRVTGLRPLVIVAQTQISVNGALDAGSHRSTFVGAGAGAASASDCPPFSANPGLGPPGGGGAGGSFSFPGGNGGTGDGVNQPGGKAAPQIVGSPTRLRGGCRGQPGAGGAQTDGGAGGGAMYLVSAGTIAISGRIDVSGAGGAGQSSQHGGGGGGSGGMIVLHASSIATTSTTILVANGGGGGGGAAVSEPPLVKSTDGKEPVFVLPIQPAAGGTGGAVAGEGAGGNGGSGFPASPLGNPGLIGLSGDIGGAGGGGGGGGGYIRSNQALGMAVVSPSPDVRP